MPDSDSLAIRRLREEVGKPRRGAQSGRVSLSTRLASAPSLSTSVGASTSCWDDVDLYQGLLRVSRAVSRVGGAVQLGPTKTASSRRQLRLPAAAVDALRQHRTRQQEQQDLMWKHWQDLGLVFPTGRETLLDPANLCRSLRAVTEQAGLGRWHPHELRHSAASLLSAAGVPLEQVADVLGHASTRVTSATYWHRTTPTVVAAARPMDQVLGGSRHEPPAQAQSDAPFGHART